ncbi:hypothetical protein K474DRAFT_1771278 [Panus rudis PR-1116 ss-1]|nr:hypothetical protein K474DRAFT_1771278 [Panus rudis PR-1116 ss-1]
MDSDDEIVESFEPQTQAAKKPAGGRARSTRSNAPVAGPSKPAAAPKGRGKKAKQPEPAAEVVELSSGEEQPLEAQRKAPKPAGKGTTQVAKGKGKAREESPVEENADAEPMDVDEGKKPPARKQAAPAQRKANSKTTKSTSSRDAEPKSNGDDSALRSEIERLRSQLDEVTKQRDKLADQMEEVLRIRHTEPEEALAQQKAQYEKRLEVQELLIHEQAQLITASKAGQKHLLHFLTREDADQEKKNLEERLAHYKAVIKEKDAQLALKDKEIALVEAQKREVEKELQLEIERAKTLVENGGIGAGAGNKKKTADDPATAAVLVLYEKITNILIVRASVKPGMYPGKPDETYDCVYMTPEDPGGIIPNLHFSLKAFWGPANDDSPPDEEPVRKVEYQPLDLEKERPENVEQLDFLQESFIFAYDQLWVFWKTLSGKLLYNTEDSQDQEDAEMVEQE